MFPSIKDMPVLQVEDSFIFVELWNKRMLSLEVGIVAIICLKNICLQKKNWGPDAA